MQNISVANAVTSAAAILKLKLDSMGRGPIWSFWYLVSNTYNLYYS